MVKNKRTYYAAITYTWLWFFKTTINISLEARNLIEAQVMIELAIRRSVIKARGKNIHVKISEHGT